MSSSLPIQRQTCRLQRGVSEFVCYFWGFGGMDGNHLYAPMGFAAWSPDGKRIAYQRSTVNGVICAENWDLFVHDVTDHSTIRLTHEGRLPPSRAAGSHALRWSPDGQQIAFTQFQKGLPGNAMFGGKTVDGRRNVYLHDMPLEVWTADVQTRDLHQVTEGFGDVLIDWR